jgi:hypothetical protein
LVFGAVSALSSQYVKNGFWLFTHDTLFSVEEGFIKGAVCDVVVSDVSLIVLFDEVINVLFA